jgi:hypothetical protein
MYIYVASATRVMPVLNEIDILQGLLELLVGNFGNAELREYRMG